MSYYFLNSMYFVLIFQIEETAVICFGLTADGAVDSG